MALQRDVKQSMELTCSTLKESKSHMSHIYNSTKDEQIKEKVKNNINQLDTLLNECETMIKWLE